MNILSTDVNLPKRAYEIYVAGCTRQCDGCHNSESWDFSRGTDYITWYFSKFKSTKLPINLIKNIWVLGGEPLDQDHSDLYSLLQLLREDYPQCKLWLWTSYRLDEIPEFLLKSVDYVKVGKYCPSSTSVVDELTGITLASSNQKIYSVDTLERTQCHC